jgi:hypothetical protein
MVAPPLCKGMGRNSLQCTSCENWIHKIYSGVKGSLQKASASFECRTCNETTGDQYSKPEWGYRVEREKVGKYCYLCDMLVAERGADLVVATRVRCPWKKFRELSPFLTAKGVFLKLKGKV